MSRAAIRAYYMLLGGEASAPVAPPPPPGDFDPYVRKAPAGSVFLLLNLAEPVSPVGHTHTLANQVT